MRRKSSQVETLVCAKDQRGFERQMADYRSDVVAMRADSAVGDLQTGSVFSHMPDG